MIFCPSSPSPAQGFAPMQFQFLSSCCSFKAAPQPWSQPSHGAVPLKAAGCPAPPSQRPLLQLGAAAGGRAGGSEQEKSRVLRFVCAAAAGFWEVRYLGSCFSSRCWRARGPTLPAVINHLVAGSLPSPWGSRLWGCKRGWRGPWGSCGIGAFPPIPPPAPDRKAGVSGGQERSRPVEVVGHSRSIPVLFQILVRQ